LAAASPDALDSGAAFVSGAACVSGAALASDPEPVSLVALASLEALGWLASECADSFLSALACGAEAGGLR
jgi:hypothetical protein